MSINPNKLDFQRQILFIPVTKFLGLSGPPTITVDKAAIGSNLELGVPSDTDGVALCNDTIADDLLGVIGVQPPAGAGTSEPEMKEIGTLGLSGLLMHQGNAIQHFMQIPPNWDRSHPIYFRVVWSSEAAAVGSRSVTWRVSYSLAQGNVNTVLDGGNSVLDTAIAADTPKGTAKTLQVTENGILNAGSLASAKTHLMLAVLPNPVTSFSEDKYFLGLEIEYTPRFGRGKNRYEALALEAA